MRLDALERLLEDLSDDFAGDADARKLDAGEPLVLKVLVAD